MSSSALPAIWMPAGAPVVRDRMAAGMSKRTAYLINAARGALVDYAALLEALRSGHIAGAAFDTFWSEPADPDDPILKEKAFFLSTHVAGFSDVSIDFVTDAVAENIRRLFDDRQLLNVV